ncbi:MAG: hypothetical protein KAU07_02950 [Candidatus Andersenbacteria bacterium]|nr:hypothetical protein [Candidatus Andersenbacteria bacterium]
MTMKESKIILKGTGASAGEVEGRVKIIKDLDCSSADFKEGDILVTRITNPVMIMIMTKAAAIVTDIGGLTSHPAIVSRELGIPCVVGTEKATKILKDGIKIKVDGKKGIIYKV